MIVAPVTVYGARSVTVIGLQAGHPVDLVGHPAPGAARQGDDGGRHGVAAAARPRARAPRPRRPPRRWPRRSASPGPRNCSPSPVSIRPDRSACNPIRWSAGATAPCRCRDGGGAGVDSSVGQATVTTPPQRPSVSADDLKGAHGQVGQADRMAQALPRRTGTAQDSRRQPRISACWSPGPAGVGKATLVRAVCADRRLVELDGPEVGALRRRGPAAQRRPRPWQTVRDGGGVLLITDIDALLPVDRRTGRHPDPDRTARGRRRLRGSRSSRRRRMPDGVDARLRGPDLCDRELGAEPARRRDRARPARGAAAQRARGRTANSTRSPAAHRVSWSPISPPCAARRHCARPRGPSADGSRPRSTQDDLDRSARGDPAAVAVGHRRGVASESVDPRRRRRHGRDQAGAHRGGAVAAAASRHVRPARRRSAARCAALRSARLRQDVRGAGAGRAPAGSACTPSRAPS